MFGVIMVMSIGGFCLAMAEPFYFQGIRIEPLSLALWLSPFFVGIVALVFLLLERPKTQSKTSFASCPKCGASNSSTAIHCGICLTDLAK
jgi:hypothetical protein